VQHNAPRCLECDRNSKGHLVAMAPGSRARGRQMGRRCSSGKSARLRVDVARRGVRTNARIVLAFGGASLA
jgi:hypothetical protein